MAFSTTGTLDCRDAENSTHQALRAKHSPLSGQHESTSPNRGRKNAQFEDEMRNIQDNVRKHI